ncbi:hypothetical protein ACFPOI_23145 [Nonomuraea angiospora]|uniref:Uncharacterized protein n=1 Tax=Nonomuraea angiospora TaxID=46172 RepID=A0ABR9MKU4_9ACTN|nr:hypothetical protein [Nonomuraea angiospora]MBE1593570.1 hypothetical protein [Nonomuraea angiospora]
MERGEPGVPAQADPQVVNAFQCRVQIRGDGRPRVAPRVPGIAISASSRSPAAKATRMEAGGAGRLREGAEPGAGDVAGGR